MIFEDIKFAIFIVLSIGLALVAIMVFIGIFRKKATGSWKFLLIPIGIFILKALVKLLK